MDPYSNLPYELAGVILLMTVTGLYAVLENTLSRMTRVDIKLLKEHRRELVNDQLLAELARGKYRVTIPLQLFALLCWAGLGMAVFLLLQHLKLPFWHTGAIFTGVMALLIYCCKLALPWAVAEHEPERSFLRLLPLLRPVYVLFRPVCRPVIRLAASRSEYQSGGDDEDEEISEEEVQAFLDVGEEEGIFEEEESRIIQQVVEFGDTIVREIMIPRTGMVAVRHDATKEELKAVMVQSRHSRIPVYKDRIDTIMGVVYVRHLLARYDSETRHESIDDIIMPAFYVPETKNISELLREMQSRGEHLTIVVDEYGGVAGLVTLEDLLEEIVGDIRDEDQPAEAAIQQEQDDAYLMEGDTGLDEAGQLLGLDLYEEGYNTIAGLIIKQLGRFPAPEEILAAKGAEIQVLDVDSRKIRRVRVKKLTGETS